MTIQWFPGHMTRARKQILAALDKTDVVLELCDARAPQSSRNPLLGELIGKKPRLVVINKSDLTSPNCLKIWKEKISEETGCAVIAVSCPKRQGLDQIKVEAKNLTRSLKWFGMRGIRILVTGIPNVGKSTLINTLSQAKKTATADKPGLTRGVQTVRTYDDIVILDTPGILWHKFEDPMVGEKLAILGSIRDEVLDTTELAKWVLGYLLENQPDKVMERYNWTEKDILPTAALEKIAGTRVPLMTGGNLDMERAGMLVLRDLREGRLGPLCLDN